MSSHNRQNIQGNQACALGAIAAGCQFFAGYPITPSSEIAEALSALLPEVGGVFIQMEDEIASMGAVIGASMGGSKAMTATSGPGFSLKQENIGYAAMTEVPCVIINVMRGGPSTGMPTRPSQGDVMQARWGTHGDHPIIALVPDSVAGIYNETIRAFNLAEKFRTPVVVLYDEILGHLLETVRLPTAAEIELIDRKLLAPGVADQAPYAVDESLVPPMALPGSGHRVHTTGLTHADSGFPTQDPQVATGAIDRLLAKIEHNRPAIESWECIETDDADQLIVAYGICARAARSAVRQSRARGGKTGLLIIKTLWPFPQSVLKELCQRVDRVLVPEMNAGQVVLEVERICKDDAQVVPLNRLDGEAITPAQILAVIAPHEPLRCGN